MLSANKRGSQFRMTNCDHDVKLLNLQPHSYRCQRLMIFVLLLEIDLLCLFTVSPAFESVFGKFAVVLETNFSICDFNF